MVTRFFGSADPPAEPIATAQPGGADSAAPAPADERRIALLVGNARYAQGKLANPVNDVRLIGKVLQALGFDVTVVEDVDKPALQAAVVAFCLRLEQAGPGAVALFYFAGHGIQHQGSNFLLPVGVAIPSTRFLPALAMPADEIVVELTRAPRKANIIILDACRNNALPGLEGESRDLMQGLAALKLPPDGVLVAYSTAAGAVAEDGDGRHSPYAEALAQALPGLLEPGRRLHDVFVEAAERVKEATGARQSPALYLQGTLPPLAVDEADRERFRTWVFYEPAWPWRRILQWGGGGLAATAAASLVVAWIAAYPETRGLWLHKAGIARSDAFDFACVPPWDKPDRYGLTRADWCARFLADLVVQVKASGQWDALVPSAVERGDPKAMALRAGELWGTYGYPVRGSPERARMVELSLRAGRAGLASAWIELQSVTRDQAAHDAITAAEASIEAEAKRGVIEAADAGVPVAQRIIGIGAIRDGDVEKAVAWIAKADANDPFGDAAYTLGEAFAGLRSHPRFPRDMAQARRWLMIAAEKGNARAYAALAMLAGNGQIALPAAEEARIVDRIVARDGPTGAFFKARRLLEPGPGQDIAEGFKQLTIAAEGGNESAMGMLGLAYKLGLVDNKPDPGRALHWLERATATGNAEGLIQLGRAYADGMADKTGRPAMPLDPGKARDSYLRALEVGDLRAALYLGNLYETGAFGKREPEQARHYYERVQRQGGARGPMTHAEQGLARLDVADYVAAPGPVDDIALGDPAALVLVAIYMPVGCSDCADAYRILVPPLVERFVVTGGARLVLREPYPAAGDVVREDASLLIRCAPKGDRWRLAERFIRDYDQWRDIADRAQRVAALEGIAAPVPIDEAAAAACLADDAQRVALRDRHGALARKFGVAGGFPMVAINGEILVRPSREALEDAVMEALSPQARAKILSEAGPPPRPASREAR